MDEDYTYDEMCPEEAEFIKYEGGESYADDDADFMHHAALYGGYLASRDSSRRQKRADSKSGMSGLANGGMSQTRKPEADDSLLGCIVFAVVIVVLGVFLYVMM